MKFEPVASEKSAAEKAAEVLVAFGWLLFFVLLAVTPIVIVAIWKALL